MHVVQFVVVVVLSAIFSGCAGVDGETEDLQLDDGKFDTFNTPGDEFTSRFIDPTRSYFDRRNIETLRRAGALISDEVEVVSRMDGIVRNFPRNGFLDREELVLMESEPYWSSLYPEEQVMFEKFWELLLVPEERLVVEPNITYDFEEVRAALPDPVVPPDSDQISALDEDLQASHARLQLQFNSDDDPTTFSIDDLEQGMENPDGRYTTQEIQHFRYGLHHMSELRKQYPSGYARLVVPWLGVREHDVGAVGDATLRQVATAYIVESVGSAGYGWQGYETQLVFTEYVHVRAPDDACLVINGDYDTYIGFGQEATVEISNAVIEVYRWGERVSASWLEQVPQHTTNDLTSDLWGYRIEDVEGNELERLERYSNHPWIGSFYDIYTGFVPENHNRVMNPMDIGPHPRLLGYYEVETDCGVFTLESYQGVMSPVVFITSPTGDRGRAFYSYDDQCRINFGDDHFAELIHRDHFGPLDSLSVRLDTCRDEEVPVSGLLRLR